MHINCMVLKKLNYWRMMSYGTAIQHATSICQHLPCDMFYWLQRNTDMYSMNTNQCAASLCAFRINYRRPIATTTIINNRAFAIDTAQICTTVSMSNRGQRGITVRQLMPSLKCEWRTTQIAVINRRRRARCANDNRFWQFLDCCWHAARTWAQVATSAHVPTARYARLFTRAVDQYSLLLQSRVVWLLVTFCVSRRRRTMYCGHARLSVCLCVCPRRTPTLLHGPGCNLGAW